MDLERENLCLHSKNLIKKYEVGRLFKQRENEGEMLDSNLIKRLGCHVDRCLFETITQNNGVQRVHFVHTLPQCSDL